MYQTVVEVSDMRVDKGLTSIVAALVRSSEIRVRRDKGVSLSDIVHL